MRWVMNATAAAGGVGLALFALAAWVVGAVCTLALPVLMTWALLRYLGVSCG